MYIELIDRVSRSFYILNDNLYDLCIRMRI
nr:MAG TPA: hypothetical protein [Caudoviricetes sp.]